MSVKLTMVHVALREQHFAVVSFMHEQPPTIEDIPVGCFAERPRGTRSWLVLRPL